MQALPAGRPGNLLKILHELRHADSLTRTDLSQRTGLAVPTVHRLLAPLLESSLVIEDDTTRAPEGLGRPATLYHFNSAVALIAGIDVGNETTRLALAAANGTIIVSSSLPTTQIVDDLPGGLVAQLFALAHPPARPPVPLAGVGVGIAASVDPESGTVSRASVHRAWDGLPLKHRLEQEFSCPVVVEQDDHLSVLAEVSDRGTVPGAASVVVVNYGRGIGVGIMIYDLIIRGARGRAGRIAYWPADTVAGTRRLADELLPDGLIASYRARGGRGPVVDGATLCQAVRNGDQAAQLVTQWAARQLGDIFLRLATTFDPEYMVMGGGFAGSFGIFQPAIREALSVMADPPEVLPTATGGSAVVMGGILAADRFVDTWLTARVSSL
jgi:predicted NBD/HSP70 family sugar kinase